MTEAFHVGQRVSYEGAACTVRFIGEVAGTSGSWLGVEWDDSTRGKHDGSHKGVRYFACLSRSSTAASFVRPSRPRDASQGFLSALREKYLSGASRVQDGAAPESQIRISGSKVAEEVGFDKIWTKLSRIADLRIVILDGMRISVAKQHARESIADTCPSIVHVDLSRNLFETIDPVVRICAELRQLRKLSLNGNRFRDVLLDCLVEGVSDAFRGVAELSLEETLLSWEELCAVAVRCPSLAALNVGSNQLAHISNVNYCHLSSHLTSINLEFNDFVALSDLESLASLTSLRNLHLKGNNIASASRSGASGPVFAPSLQYLDLSYNNISGWYFVDALPIHFPGLSALRLSHNPVYDAKDDGKKASSSEESHMFTIGRLANLKSLNFAAVKPADRTNAEMFYLSRIARQLATVPEGAEHDILAQHPRYRTLCDLYGKPDVVRRTEINPSYLEARLITVSFHYSGGPSKKTLKIPKSFDVYAIKGIAGNLFKLPPLKVRLIWETDEWDPVAGYDDHDEESGDEEGQGKDGEPADSQGQTRTEDRDGESGRWIKREVELKDGPKQLGYCVDGLDVSIRIEMRC
ncbi:uncharacterized protein UV8b_02103 [Ustilaginoidea virens]|uniref:CAP-Gly domain-containing protein n=1 Tax=Ustilaginoidea virens TaxID=1159556 RepID=A0A8E5HM57_USTVR|nr:uncharacterized protein UV8b_02103 [Ustilaginoidea virens]QUC17862.1 hypothetical protein UV8b_02103 [Ustilaginoidea virens]